MVEAYLASFRRHSPVALSSGIFTLRYAVCKILYTLCKVRGEKIIVGFLNNDPRYLEPLLTAFENGTRQPDVDGGVGFTLKIGWEERYILLLWLSHLMLAPFDLSSISSLISENDSHPSQMLPVPQGLPSIALRVIPICSQFLNTATRERTAAASLLVRLCLRPDMRKAGLLDAIILFALSTLNNSVASTFNIHQPLGILVFLSKLVASGNHDEIGNHVTAIFNLSMAIHGSEDMAAIRTSAVARKLNIKIIRCIVLLCLQSPVAGLDTTSVVEESVGCLLETVADGDSPVRFAASKAISLITLSLDASMAGEVIDAVLACFNEDVLWNCSVRNLNAVNPLRWHGLTLTLSHLLYRRVISTTKLPELLNALLLALSFEQRSSTGSSVGTNVRDAANFGIWALSRRYTTTELLVVDASTIRATKESRAGLSVPQTLAIELVESACLDPAGNVRRGSSAALQELIGRHPDTISQGIPLVQTVDFQAVGLRERAMVDVTFAASGLEQVYWNAIFDALLGWRGIGANASQSRVFAAKAIGRLSSCQPIDQVHEMATKIIDGLSSLVPRQVEERQGLVMALASLINVCISQLGRDQEDVNSVAFSPVRRTSKDLSSMANLWSIPSSLQLEEKDFMSIAVRPELTATAICDLLAALATLSSKLQSPKTQEQVDTKHLSESIRLLEFCLQRPEDTILEMITNTTQQITSIMPIESRVELAKSWIGVLEAGSGAMSKKTGHPIALGSIFDYLQNDRECQIQIVKALCERCTASVNVEARVVALKSLVPVGRSMTNCREEEFVAKVIMLLSGALLVGLNDYTINERGDVGSLVRLEALNTVELVWFGCQSNDDMFQNKQFKLTNDALGTSVVRLSLEKLDKLRNRASKCLDAGYDTLLPGANVLIPHCIPSSAGPNITPYYKHEASSYEYFYSALSLLDETSSTELHKSILQGYISSAGMGSEAILQASRQALIDYATNLPIVFDKLKNGLSLGLFATLLMEILEDSLTKDRILIPLLETLGFLMDMQIIQRMVSNSVLPTGSFKYVFLAPCLPAERLTKCCRWRKLLSLIQKSHYKSNNMQKLHMALDMYRNLADIQTIRKEVIDKVISMLLHPFPKVRNSISFPSNAH